MKSQMERLCSELNGLGIDAQLSETHQHEQDIGQGSISLFNRNPSYRLIKIKDGPIRWINLIGAQRPAQYNEPVTAYHMDYGVPLTIASKITKAWIFTARRKRFPIFGPVVRIHWRGGRWSRKVADQLNGDPIMVQPAVMDAGIELTCDPEHMCWIISAQEWRIQYSYSPAEGWRIPSRERWNAYQALARHLVTATQTHMQIKPPGF